MVTNMNVSMRYSTFQPMLLEALRRTDGDVLELGAGVFSTPLIHWWCESKKRNLLTVESDRKWFNFTRQYLRTDHHKFLFVNNWDEAKPHIDKEWDVVLVDHSPSGRRIKEIILLANLAKFIVVHDSEPSKDYEYHYSRVYPLFKYKYNFDLADHATAVLSNFHPVDDFWQPSNSKKDQTISTPSRMKNLMIYINPVDHKFSEEYDELTKIQIDNSLELGWKPEDILLVTNFNYEYKGVQSIKVDDYKIFDQNRSSKIPVINELFNRRIIKDDYIYWFHDHDAFQLIPFDIKLESDAGFTTHGAYKPTLWNAGSFFFKKSAEGIFLDVWRYMNKRSTNEQDALTYIWQNNVNEMSSKYELMDISYNLNIYRIAENIQRADLPIKVTHFHPHKKRHLNLFREILPKRLLKIFESYGIKLEDLSSNEELIKDLESVRNSRKHFNWEPFMRKYNCEVICEIGVCKGANFFEMIKHKPKLAVAVDSWIEDGTISRNDGRYSQTTLNKQYEDFKKSVTDKPYVKIYREYSFDAVKHFNNNYFDLVYIDADHTYEGCLKDIEDWFPKVKHKGLLLGDDYIIRNYRVNFGVIKAVNEFAKKNNLKFYTLPFFGWGIIKP